MTELAKQHTEEAFLDFEYPGTRHSSGSNADLDTQGRVQLDQNPVIEEWLSLTDYSSKYRVSVSTLRRRIKSNQIAHRFVDGRYVLLDSRPAELDHSYHQQETLEPVLNPSSAAEFLRGLEIAKTAAPETSSSTHALSELKRAYSNILHEKEEAIIQLKKEVSDLQTFVRALEDDNARMRRALGLERLPS